MIPAVIWWVWGGLAPWAVWLWGMFAGVLGHALHCCGVLWIGEKCLNWRSDA
jgi:hypothetical protein